MLIWRKRVSISETLFSYNSGLLVKTQLSGEKEQICLHTEDVLTAHSGLRAEQTIPFKYQMKKPKTHFIIRLQRQF